MNEFAVLAQLTVVAMVPYLLASLGTMLGGLTGVFSVSQEGVMLLGASVGFLISYGTGSTALGILLAARRRRGVRLRARMGDDGAAARPVRRRPGAVLRRDRAGRPAATGS